MTTTSLIGSHHPTKYRIGHCVQAATPEKAQVGRIDYEDGFVGGECIFIPSKPDDGDGDGEPEGGEDDGYLATFVSRKDGTGTSGEHNSHAEIGTYRKFVST